MDPTRKNWNEGQKRLRKLLSNPSPHPQAIDLFIRQHAEVHSAAMSSSGNISFEDEVVIDLNDLQMREIPQGMDHSIAWILWHLARIEDVTMNILVAGKDQVLYQDDWQIKVNVSVLHTGNGMTIKEVKDLSNDIDLEALINYRLAVGRRTEQIVKELEPVVLKQKVAGSRLKLLIQDGAVVEKASGLIDYWSKRDIKGLLLMPPTRHCFVHLNEAAKIKKRILF
jgi:hypothetical protein